MSSSAALASLRPEAHAAASTSPASTAATPVLGDRRGTFPIPSTVSSSSTSASTNSSGAPTGGLQRSSTTQFAPPPPRPRPPPVAAASAAHRADTPQSYTDSRSHSPSSSDSEDDDGPHDNHAAHNSASAGNGTHQHGGNSGNTNNNTPPNTQAAAGGTGGANPTDVKKPRACEACRGLKVRCDMDPNAPPETPCRRCAKAGRQCIVTQPTRRRQKKTDSRVAELEKKIDALTASLQMTRQAGGAAAANGTAGGVGTNGNTATPHVSIQGGPSAATNMGSQSSPYSANSVGRSSYSSAPPPMVMAGQKRKFSEMREASGVVAAGAGNNGAGSRPGSFAGSRSGSVIGDESPSTRDYPYHNTNHLHYHGPAPPPSQSYGQQSPIHQTTPQNQQSQAGGGGSTQQQQPQPQQQATPSSYRSPMQGGPGEYADVIDRGLLTMGQAIELFQRYNEGMVRHMPAVVFPPCTTAAEVRKTKPVLFLAIMAAASSEMHTVQRTLVRELMQIFANKIVIVGEKSLELVQALQVAVVWYWPPEHFEELKFYQLVHMAAVMAIEIGLGRRRPSNMSGGMGAGVGTLGIGKLGRRCWPGGIPGVGASAGSGGMNSATPAPTSTTTGATPASAATPNSNNNRGGYASLNWRENPFKKHPLPDPGSVESRRAWLSCYFMTSNTSMALHRPNLLRWSTFMSESVDVLEKSPDAAPTDQYLCHLVWTHRLSEEVGLQFAMDDPMAMISVSDQRTQYALRGFEREMVRYKASIPQTMLQPCLRMSFEVLNLYMHEIALQNEGGADDYHPAYAPNGNSSEPLASDATLSSAHIGALSACLQAIDGIFDAFLGLDIDSLRCVPVFTFVRVAYAMVVLIKLYFAASAPDSELGKVINRDNMKVEQHLNALLEKFRATAADNKSRPAGKFLIVLVMVRSWFHKQRQMSQAALVAQAQGLDAGPGLGSSQSVQDALLNEQAAKRGSASASQAGTDKSPKNDPTAATPSSSTAAGVQQDTPSQTPTGGQMQTPQQMPYLPSSTFLSGNNNVNSANNAAKSAVAASTSAPTQVSSPSVVSVSASASGVSMSSPAVQSPSFQQQMPAAYASANTPLELLSEIAANDQAATAAAQAQQQQQQQQQQQMVTTAPMPWYNGGASVSGPGSGVPGVPPSVPPGVDPNVPGVTGNPNMDYFSYPSLGDNFEYALDLTLGGLPDGSGNNFDNMDFTSDSLASMIMDPWFGGAGDTFQF